MIKIDKTFILHILFPRLLQQLRSFQAKSKSAASKSFGHFSFDKEKNNKLILTQPTYNVQGNLFTNSLMNDMLLQLDLVKSELTIHTLIQYTDLVLTVFTF